MKRLALAILVFLALFGIVTLEQWFMMPPIARAQMNTFCAANLPCTVTGIWTFTGVPVFPNGATFTGAVTATGLFSCKNFEQIACVDPANLQGWTGSDFGAWINSAIASLPTDGTYRHGTVYLFPSSGTSLVTQSTTVTISTPFVSIIGPGASVLQITCTMNADCWNVHMAGWPGNIGSTIAGRIGGFSLQGQNTTNASAIGLHIGDVIGATFEDISIANFNGASSACVWLDNINGFTERNMFRRIQTGANSQGPVSGCTKAFRWTNTGNTNATSSFGHNFYQDISYAILNAQTGLSFEGGATYDIPSFNATGNASAGTTSIGLTISGLAYSGGPNTVVDIRSINMQVECTSPCTAGTLLNMAAGYQLVTGPAGIVRDNTNILTNSANALLVRVFNNDFFAGEQARFYPTTTTSANYFYWNIQAPGAVRQLNWPDPGGNAGFVFGPTGPTSGHIPTFNGNAGLNDLGSTLAAGQTIRSIQNISDQGNVCTNGELALSAGWQSTGSATVTAVAGNGQTCSWTITTGTTTAANPTVTDTLTNALPSATTVCWMNIYGGTHTAVAGESLRQTTLSATAPVFTANFTPTAGGTTYFVTRGCGP